MYSILLQYKSISHLKVGRVEELYSSSSQILVTTSTVIESLAFPGHLLICCGFYKIMQTSVFDIRILQISICSFCIFSKFHMLITNHTVWTSFQYILNVVLYIVCVIMYAGTLCFIVILLFCRQHSYCHTCFCASQTEWEFLMTCHAFNNIPY